MQEIVFDKDARQLLQLQRHSVVTATSSAESDPFNERQKTHSLFNEECYSDREEFGKKLKQIF